MTAQHLLIPLDFSPYADLALDYAIDLAKTLQARLTLLHVIHTLPLAVGIGDASAVLAESYLQEMEAEAQKNIQDVRNRVDKAHLPCDVVIMHGIPFQTIVEAARDRNIDLIVMGTHGRTGLTHIFLGSVAEKVVRLAPCPVLVVRDGPVSRTL